MTGTDVGWGRSTAAQVRAERVKKSDVQILLIQLEYLGSGDWGWGTGS